MHKPYAIPVSAKGVVFEDGKVWLRKNQHGEWELPGGKVDQGEQPSQTLTRELREELGIETEVGRLVQAYIHTIDGSIDKQNGVLILSYVCKILSKTGDFEYIGEMGRAEFKPFAIDELANLNLPSFYKSAINEAIKEK